MNNNQIEMCIHCALCLAELDSGKIDASPRDYQRIQVGWTKPGLQVWCTRHDVNILHVDFQEVKHPADTSRKALKEELN